MSTLNIITEWEECIRSQCNIRHLIQPCTFLFLCKYFRFLCESFLPHTISKYIHIFIPDININGIVTFRTWNCIFKWQIQHFRALAKEPVVCLLSCKSCTMYTWLLSCTNTDSLSIFYETYRVGLCIFQDDQRNLHITFCFLCKLFILCHNIGKHCIIDLKLLTALLKSYTKYFFVFQRSRYKVLIDLDHIVVSFFLLLQDLQCFLCVSRCNNTVRYLSLD